MSGVERIRRIAREEIAAASDYAKLMYPRTSLARAA